MGALVLLRHSMHGSAKRMSVHPSACRVVCQPALPVRRPSPHPSASPRYS